METKITNRELSVSMAALSRRRQARRFNLKWPVVIRGYDQRGKAFQEFCSLKNISATGACLGLKKPLAVGTNIELDVRTPLSQKHWLRYFGKVVYVERQGGAQVIGVHFDSARPAFVPTAAVVHLNGAKDQRDILH